MTLTDVPALLLVGAPVALLILLLVFRWQASRFRSPKTERRPFFEPPAQAARATFDAATIPITEYAALWQALTRRERQVARLMAEGNSDKEIAHRLGVSVRTVEFHNHNIFKKLNVHSRTKVAIIVQQLG